jgi:hypothetical protein
VSHKGGPSGAFNVILGMAQNFIDCDREQVFLLPPSLREWLPEDHLAWFVIGAVEQLDLAAFYRAYREDGHGRAAYDPAMWWRWCCMRMRLVSVLRGGSSVTAVRTSLTG